jgi:hypothetical protein
MHVAGGVDAARGGIHALALRRLRAVRPEPHRAAAGAPRPPRHALPPLLGRVPVPAVRRPTPAPPGFLAS